MNKRRNSGIKNSVFNNYYNGLNSDMNNLMDTNDEYEQEFSEELFDQEYSRLNDNERNLVKQPNEQSSRKKSWKIKGER